MCLAPSYKVSGSIYKKRRQNLKFCFYVMPNIWLIWHGITVQAIYQTSKKHYTCFCILLNKIFMCKCSNKLYTEQQKKEKKSEVYAHLSGSLQIKLANLNVLYIHFTKQSILWFQVRMTTANKIVLYIMRWYIEQIRHTVPSTLSGEML